MIGSHDPNIDFTEILKAIENLLVKLQRGSDEYRDLEAQVKKLQEQARLVRYPLISFGAPIGSIKIPNISMGNIDSINLLDLDELILFSLYTKMLTPGHAFLDLGANLGLHSSIANRLGATVKCYEPDPKHNELSKDFWHSNNIAVELFTAAIGVRDGIESFTRVAGNTMSSHITGKKSPYGPVETFAVEIHDVRKVISTVDFVKIDIEGMEDEVVPAIINVHKNVPESMPSVVCEIGSEHSARLIWNAVTECEGIVARTQKRGWLPARDFVDLPISYKDGSCFIFSEAKAAEFERNLK